MFTTTELKELVFALAWNDGFGCYTRAGFEKLIWPEIATKAKWIIYFDIDNMHGLNAAHGGYDQVDAMIKQVLINTRASDHAAGQWKSGDEFLICLTESDQREKLDPEGMRDRLVEELKKQGMTATFAIVQVISQDLSTNVKPAVDRVYELKNSRSSDQSERRSTT